MLVEMSRERDRETMVKSQFILIHIIQGGDLGLECYMIINGSPFILLESWGVISLGFAANDLSPQRNGQEMMTFLVPSGCRPL